MLAATKIKSLFDCFPNAKLAAAIYARHERQDHDRLARMRDRVAQIRDLKTRRGTLLNNVRHLEEFDRRGMLVKEIPARDEDGFPVVYDEKHSKAGNIVRQLVPDPILKEHLAEIRGVDLRVAEIESVIEPRCLTAGRIAAQVAVISPDATITECIVTPKKNSTLASVRRAIMTKREERADVSRRNRTKAEMKTAALAQLRNTASRGVPRVRGLLEGGNIEFGKTKLPKVGNSFAYINDSVALLAYLFESELAAKIDELIDVNADDSNAMTAREQAAELAKIDSEILALRREEAALVEATIADGGNAFHFPDAPVEAVFSIAIELP